MKLIEAIAGAWREITAAVTGPAPDRPVSTGSGGIIDSSLLPPLDDYRSWNARDEKAVNADILSDTQLSFLGGSYIDVDLTGDPGAYTLSHVLNLAQLYVPLDSRYSQVGHQHDELYSPIGHDHDGYHVRLAGDTMTGQLKGITPLADEDLTRKDYVDQRVRWRGYWTPSTYLRNDMVLDGAWAMIANTETEDRASPQPVGEVEWLSGLDDDPGFTSESDGTTAMLVTGQRYTFVEGGYVTAVRVWADGDPAVTFQIWSVVDPEGQARATQQAKISWDTPGWKVVPLGQLLVYDGTVVDVFVAITRDGSPGTTFSGEWVYERRNGDPDDNVIRHQSNNYEMRISHQANSGEDYQTELEALGVGDTIQGASFIWTITEVIGHFASHVSFRVDPASRASNGTYSFSFVSIQPVPLPYHRILDYYAGVQVPVEIRGLYSSTGYYNAVLDDHAYGVDIEYQEAEVSPDWDPLAVSTGIASGVRANGLFTLPELANQITDPGVAGALYHDGAGNVKVSL